MARSDAITRTGTGRPAIELAALAVGATFTLVGILGFIPGVTQNYDAMEFAGHESGAELLGLFQVSVLHNAVHLLFGLAGFLAARTIAGARTYLVGGGLVYAALAIYGMVIDRISDANFVPVNDADNWLHVGLAAGMIVLGLALSPRSASTA
ncbi:MAG TPA: DUF4383 domain-containing protein [Acidimicrobiia bacterium]|nr:DUF4383 domain-containing protein [Acidimicrobiia bacterium]